jgi:hypothetical protein
VKNAGYIVASFSPYWNLNSNVFVWSQFEEYVTRSNEIFKNWEVCQLVDAGLVEVTAER